MKGEDETHTTGEGSIPLVPSLGIDEEEEQLITEVVADLRNYQGLDYWPPKNTYHDGTLKNQTPDEHLRAKWVCFAFIGFAVAIISFTMKQSIEGIIIKREELVGDIVLHGVDEVPHETQDGSSDTAKKTASRAAEILSFQPYLLERTITVDGNWVATGGPFGEIGTKIDPESAYPEAFFTNLGWFTTNPEEPVTYRDCLQPGVKFYKKGAGVIYTVSFSRSGGILGFSPVALSCATADNKTCSCNSTEGPTPTLTEPVRVLYRKAVPGMNTAKGWFFWTGSSCILVLISSLVVLLEPRASGSGLPEVMAYLNGVQLTKSLGGKVVICKFLSCLCAVASGLPVGPEGPMIHLGAMVGAAMTQSSDSAWGVRRRLISEGANKKFRSTRERRDFIACGAAAGVSAAFGAPLGGLLFVMEEVATHWDTSLTWLIFFGTMIAFFCSAVLMSLFHGWKPTGIPFGQLSPSAQVLFQPELVLRNVEVHIGIIIPAMLVGVVCGFLAVYFTKLNIIIAKWRLKTIKPKRHLRVLEPLLLAFVFGSVTYFMPKIASCHEMPADKVQTPSSSSEALLSLEDTADHGKSFMTFPCEVVGEFSPLGTLTLNSGETVIKHLFSKGTRSLFPGGVLFVFLITYFLFSAYAASNTYASGLVVPILVIGAVTGRLLGELAKEIIPAVFGTMSWIDPGIFALIGAASFFAGVSRLTVSLAVIMVELSNELYWLPAMMCGIMVAKWVADYHCHSLYHSLIHLRDMPFLTPEGSRPPHLQVHTAADIATNPAVTLHETCTVKELMELLVLTHNGFPVLDENERLKGILMRIQIETLLYQKFFDTITEIDLVRGLGEAYEPSLTKRGEHLRQLLELRKTLTPADEETEVDLSDYYSSSPFIVHKDFRLDLVYIMFQSLGLRHLCVITSDYTVFGIITRKDLVDLDKRLEENEVLDEGLISPQHRRRKSHAPGFKSFTQQGLKATKIDAAALGLTRSDKGTPLVSHSSFGGLLEKAVYNGVKKQSIVNYTVPESKAERPISDNEDEEEEEEEEEVDPLAFVPSPNPLFYGGGQLPSVLGSLSPLAASPLAASPLSYGQANTHDLHRLLEVRQTRADDISAQNAALEQQLQQVWKNLNKKKKKKKCLQMTNGNNVAI